MSARGSEKTRVALENLRRSLRQLEDALARPSLNDLELTGALKTFEFCYELGWKALQKLAQSQGRPVASPREAFRFALEAGLISEERLWLEMIEDRNLTVQVYDRSAAERIQEKVRSRYFAALDGLAARLNSAPK